MKIEKYAVITPEAIAKWIEKDMKNVYGVKPAGSWHPSQYVELFKEKIHAYRPGVFVSIEHNVPSIILHVVIKGQMPIAVIVKNLREVIDYTLREKMSIKKYMLDIKLHVS
jgi:uncharacterized alkaline shock family protein YloU